MGPEAIKSARDIGIGDQITLILSNSDTGEVGRYPSWVEDFTKEGIAVSMPIDRQGDVPLPRGTSLEVSIWKGYADHRFRTRVLRRVTGRLPQLILAKPGPEGILRTTRREYFRVDVRIPASVYTANVVQTEVLQTTILNLSAGGCCLQAPKRVCTGAPVLLDFDLSYSVEKDVPEQTRCLRQIPGRVKTALLPGRNAGSPEALKDIYFLGIEFSTLSLVTKTVLLHYVAFRERELIRLGVLE